MTGKSASKRSRRSKDGRTRGRVSVIWLLLAVVTAATVAVGACALLLPDRPPALLGKARTATSVSVESQQYAGQQQVTVVPTVSQSRQLVGNATGVVTADWSGGGLVSGRAAYAVNGRVVVAFGTATPLYRDLVAGDTGGDVLAVNNELNRLGYSSSPESDTFTWRTRQGWRQLMLDRGNESDGTLLLADTLWIPEAAETVANWTATVGSTIAAGSSIGEIPGTLTRLDIRNGQASDRDRTLTVFGQSTTLPAGATGVDDAAFCAQVSATADFQSLAQSAATGAADLSAGLDATLALPEPVTVLRVPAASVFGADGTTGCIAANGGTIPVSIVGSELGVSLVQPTDGTDLGAIDSVSLGTAIAGLSCS